MENFLSGKASKVTAIFLLMLVPRLITSTIFEYDYELGTSIGAILTILFMKRFVNSDAVSFKNDFKSIKPSVIVTLAIAILSFQLTMFYLAMSLTNVEITKDWLTFDNFISPVIIAPFAEEITFRWAMTETCIDKNTSKFKKVLFVVFMLFIWNFVHTKSLTSLNIQVILIGLLFYMIYFRSGNIIYCMAAHMFANLYSALLTSPLQSGLSPLFNNSLLPTVYVIILIVSVVLVFGKIETSKV